MTKRYKDIRGTYLDDWEDIRREDRLKDKQKHTKRKNKRQNKYEEKFRNFKDFSEDY